MNVINYYLSVNWMIKLVLELFIPHCLSEDFKTTVDHN